MFVVVACVAAPTVALESGSDTWTPGTRWPMIYQLTSPVLLLALAAALLRAAAPPLRARLWSGAVALAIAIGALFSLGHNRLQVEYTANEKFIRDSMRRLVAEDLAAGLNPPTQILLKLDYAEPIALAVERHPESDDRTRLAAKRRRLVSPGSLVGASE